MLALDQSNYSNVPSDAAYEWLKNQGYGLLMPQAIDPPAGYPPRNVEALVQRALDHGFFTMPYVWKWFGTGLDDIQRRVDLLAPWSGQIDALTLDVEDIGVGYAIHVLGTASLAIPTVPPEAQARIQRQPPPVFRTAKLGATSLQQRIDEVLAALDVLARFPTKTGAVLIYTGGWYWGPYMGGTTAISAAGYGLHAAQYDGIADATVVGLYGGWTLAYLKQHVGTSTVGAFTGVDQDVLHPAMLDVLMPAPPSPPPAPDYRTALADVLNPDGEIVPALLAVINTPRLLLKSRSALQAIVDRLGAIHGEFLS